MIRHRKSVWLAVISLVSAPYALAQAPTPPDPTAPSAASSPHQRESTTTEAAEAPATSGAEPSSASSPHQQQATKTTKAEREQMMKDCMKTEQERDSTLSKEQVKKNCKEQIKTQTKSY